MKKSEYIDLLKAAIRDLHACDSFYLETEMVAEQFQGESAWEGKVEVFALIGHPRAQKGYAWSSDENGERKITAVLELPPVSSARSAVQASLLASLKKQADFKPGISGSGPA